MDIRRSASWRDGKTTAERGYGWRWQKARETYLRSHPLCEYCAKKNIVRPASVVDHKTPHKGDMTLFWDETNWQPLCAPCHDITKAEEEGRIKARPTIGIDGYPVTE